MSATPDSTLADSEQLIADLRRRLAEREAELAEAREQQTATAEVLQVINSSPGDLAPVFDAMLEKAVRLCGANFGGLTKVDGEDFHYVAMHNVPPAFAESMRQPRPIGPGVAHYRLLNGEEVVQVQDVTAEDIYRSGEPGRRALADLGGARTVLWAALRKDDTLLGAFVIYRQEVRPFTDKQIALLQNFAAQAVIAMENARLITETREALEQQTATAEVLGVINSSPGNLTPVFEAMLEKALSLCDVGYGCLRTYDGKLFHPVADRGNAQFSEIALGWEPFEPLPGSPPARIASGEAVVQIADLVANAAREPSNPRARALVEIGGARTAIWVAMRNERQLLGYITAYRQEAKPFTEKQITLLQNFAAQAVIAMENARLITETREALEQQTATAEVLGVINSSPGDLTPVFDAILEKAHTLCGATLGTLRVIEGEYVRSVAQRGHSAGLADELRERAPLSDATVTKALVDGAPFAHILDMAELDHPAARRAAQAGVRTLLAVPLRKDNALLGAIFAGRQEVRPYTDKQIALLQNFAVQAVIAMENARLITETREALEQQTATAEVLQVINSSPGELAPVFEAILEKAHALCGAEIGSLTIYDGETNRAVATRGLAPALADRLRQGFRPGPEHPIRKLLSGARVVQVSDVGESADPVARHSFEAGIRTSLYVPLRKDDRLLGLIVASRQEVRPFTDKQIALLENFAAQAVIAMENARLITETREALEQQTATAEVLGVINSSPGDLAPVFDAMLDKALRLCEAAFGGLWTYDGGNFRSAAMSGVPTPFAEFCTNNPPVFGPGSGPARLVEGEPFNHVVDLTASEAYLTGEPNRKALVDLGGARTALAVPLRKDDALVGLIMIYRQEVRPFSDKKIALLQNFAAQAVIAMENARLITETREALQQQTATAEVLGVINASPGDLGPVFEVMLDRAISLCEAAYGVLWTYSDEGFRAATLHGVPQPYAAHLAQEPIQLARGTNTALGQIADGSDFAHFEDVASEEGYMISGARRLIELGGARTVMVVALRKDGKLLGAISAFRQEVRPFTDKQIALLQNFAAQAVIAMENARLLGELRQSTEEVAELNRGLEARVAEQVEELGRVGRLKRFLAPQLAEMIVSQGDEQILESHRRDIVVVFCDLRGYTAFTETAEPEEVLDFLREYHGALGPLVSQFEGTLDQFSGDGIMVFFNDPIPCPDPAERAVKMAVAMREAAGALIVEWRERGRDLGFGAGIAQGYATLGQIGFSERSGYTAIGTVCNVAARLCAEAKDGQILLSQRVNVGLKGSLATEQIGALTLKGLTQPIVAYNVPLAAAQPVLRVIEGGDPQSV
jgi:GAF domain-containing protein